MLLELAIKDQITALVVELIELNGTLKELERAFPYTSGGYYYARKVQVTNRINDVKEILTRTNSGYQPELAPEQQFLVTRR